MEPTITDAPDAGRYEVRIDGDLAGILEYVVKRNRIALAHTDALPAGSASTGTSRSANRGGLGRAEQQLEVSVLARRPREHVRPFIGGEEEVRERVRVDGQPRRIPRSDPVEVPANPLAPRAIGGSDDLVSRLVVQLTSVSGRIPAQSPAYRRPKARSVSARPRG
jgi:hypothetical protein